MAVRPKDSIQDENETCPIHLLIGITVGCSDEVVRACSILPDSQLYTLYCLRNILSEHILTEFGHAPYECAFLGLAVNTTCWGGCKPGSAPQASPSDWSEEWLTCQLLSGEV